MVMFDPYWGSPEQTNTVWQETNWESPTGFFQAYQLSGMWEPYETFHIKSDWYSVLFHSEPWTAVTFNKSVGTEDFIIDPPSLLIFAGGYGDDPAAKISTGREAADALAGLINLIVGKGYPILIKVYESAFKNDQLGTIKYYPARTEVSTEGMTRDGTADAFKRLAIESPDDIPDRIKLSLRWYSKGMLDDNPVDRFISLYESSIAVIGPWHHETHPEAYIERDPPPRKMFGDWVRDITNPANEAEEKKRFQPFRRMVSTRNNIFKGSKLLVAESDIADATSCSVQLLNWALLQLKPSKQ
jgi:hypothetical protein